jgi:Galactose oxidase, central domain
VLDNADNRRDFSSETQQHGSPGRGRRGGGGASVPGSPLGSTSPARGPRGSPGSASAGSEKFRSPSASVRARAVRGSPGLTVGGQAEPSLPVPNFSSGWHHIPQGNFRPLRRHGHSAEVFRNLVITYGGVTDCKVVGDMWMFDTNTNRWLRFEPVDRMTPGKRSGHATCMIGMDMYLFAGETGLHTDNELWRFNMESRRWTHVKVGFGDAPRARCGHKMVPFGRYLVVFGGADRYSSCFDDLWVFDVDSCTWRGTELNTNRPAARRGHTLCVVDEEIILFGGFGGSERKSRRLSDAWALDPNSLTWTRIDHESAAGDELPWPAGRADHTCVGLGRKMVLFGGMTNSGCVSDLWEFDPNGRRWTQLEFSKQPDPSGPQFEAAAAVVGPARRHAHVAVAFRGTRIFLWGGRGQSAKDREDMWFVFLDPSLDNSHNLSLSTDHLDGVGREQDQRLLNVQEALNRDLEALRDRLDVEHHERIDAETLTTHRWENQAAVDAAQDERVARLERRLRQWQLNNSPQATRERLDKLDRRLETGLAEARDALHRAESERSEATTLMEGVHEVLDQAKTRQSEMKEIQARQEEQNQVQHEEMRNEIAAVSGSSKESHQLVKSLQLRLREQREKMEQVTADQAALKQIVSKSSRQAVELNSERHDELLELLQQERDRRTDLETRVAEIEQRWKEELAQAEARLEQSQQNAEDREEMLGRISKLEKVVHSTRDSLHKEFTAGLDAQSSQTAKLQQQIEGDVEGRLKRIREQIGLLLTALHSKGEEEERQLTQFVKQVDRTDEAAKAVQKTISDRKSSP